MRPLPPSLTLLVPGLLGPFSGDVPRLPALEWLLARADVEGLKAPSGLETTLFCLFEVQNGGIDAPIGAVCRYGDGGAPDAEYWFRADPVRLAAHQDRVYLVESDSLDLSLDEAQALAAELNAHFAPDGLAVEVGRPGRWYLRTLDDPDIRTVPTRQLLGCDLFPHLPRGRREGFWRAWLNEVQMLFHASPVNAAREARGAPPVNGLWIWGGGRLPDGATSKFQAIFSSECVAPGLARLATVGCDPLPEDFETLLARVPGPGRLLAVNDLLRAPVADNAALLHSLEERWFAPAREALRSGRLAALEIIPADGRLFRIGRRATRRFWRRRRPLDLHPAGR